MTSSCDKCTLCYTANETPCALSPCAHVFCIDCLHRYDGDRCPLCRVKFERILPLRYGADSDAFQGKQVEMEAVRRRGEMTLGRRRRREERRATRPPATARPPTARPAAGNLIDALRGLDMGRLVDSVNAGGGGLDAMLNAFQQEMTAAGAGAGELSTAIQATQALLGPLIPRAEPEAEPEARRATRPASWRRIQMTQALLGPLDFPEAEPEAPLEAERSGRGWFSALVNYLWS